MDEDILAPEELEDNGLDGDTELLEALKALKNQDNEDDDEEEIVDEEPEQDEEEDLPKDEEEEEELPVDTKKPQSKEDNAKFAAQRRQAELDKRVQAELDRIKQSAPEFQLAKRLSDMYGDTPENIIKQMEEAALQKEAADKNLPIELLRERQAERQRLESVEQELNQLRFERWQGRIQSEGQELQTKYPMLSQDDIDASVNYILDTVKNVDMPLEEAVYALHGKKIIENLANAKVQDKLASDGGRRKRTPVAPNNGNPASSANSLTSEERNIAKAFGMSEADYLKYKS